MGKQVKQQTDEVIEIMNETFQKDLTVYDDAFLLKSLERRMAAIQVEKQHYGLYLQENSHEAEILAASLNITYSQFFRNPLTFAMLERLVLPNILNHKPEGGEIRVWSAGCSAGQEAYSIGILLEELIANSSKSMRFRIFATDISQAALSVAKAGNYDEDAVANLKIQHLKKYFAKNGEIYTINPQLKRKIDFSHYDLLDQYSINPPDSIFGDFDIIFCCNLLFYYKTDVRRLILKKIKRSLANNGYLVTGEAESIFMGKDEELRMMASSSSLFQINNNKRYLSVK